MLKETTLITACVFGFGFAQSVPVYLLWLAVEDIISGTLIESSIPMMLFAIGEIVSKFIAAWMLKKTYFLASAILLGMIDILAYLLLVVFDQVKLRLAGAFFMGLKFGLCDVMSCYLIARFPNAEIYLSAFQIGLNMAPLVVGLAYTGSTIWLCFPPRWTVATICPIAVLVFVFYGILNHGPLKKCQIQQDSHKSTQYTPVSSDNKKNSNQRHYFLIRQVTYLYDVFEFFLYYFVSYSAFYLAFSSVLTTMSFPASPFRIRDHYHYYKLLSDVGMVLGGSEVLVASCLCPRWLDFFYIRKIWVLVVLNVGHLMFFTFAAWYHFVPNVYVLLFLSGTYGFVYGLVTVHNLVAISEKFQKPYEKGLALTITGFGCTIGRLVSGFLGIFVEEHLRLHCTNNLLMGEYCLAIGLLKVLDGIKTTNANRSVLGQC